VTFLLYSNVFVALCAASLVAATRLMLTAEPNFGVLELHVWFATMTVYNIDRLVDEGDQVHASPRHEWIARHRFVLWWITVVSAIGTLVTMWFLGVDVVLGLAPLAVVSFFYSVPLFGRDVRLKSLPGAKTFVIAAVWAVVTVVMPALDMGVAVPWVLLVERLLFIFAITLPFDLRDVRRDEAVGVRSLPQVLGSARTIALSIGLLAAAAAVALWRTGFGIEPATFAAPSALVLAAVAVFPARRPQPDAYYSFVLDGTMLVYALAVFMTAC
jgi:4-hydroxybenzoate polyprenyltransferase